VRHTYVVSRDEGGRGGILKVVQSLVEDVEEKSLAHVNDTYKQTGM
jgi:hypothetical protein